MTARPFRRSASAMPSRYTMPAIDSPRALADATNFVLHCTDQIFAGLTADKLAYKCRIKAATAETLLANAAQWRDRPSDAIRHLTRIPT